VNAIAGAFTMTSPRIRKTQTSAKEGAALMRFAALADHLNISLSKLYRLREGDRAFRDAIPTFKIGSFAYVARADVDAYVERLRQEALARQQPRRGRPRKAPPQIAAE